jgi:hypothetical protein
MTGAITSGSINLDGQSAIRRTCTLGIAITDAVLTDNYYWTLNSKFQAWIGLKNNVPGLTFTVNGLFPDLIMMVTNPQ